MPGGAASCSGSCTTLAFGNETGDVVSTVRLTVGGGAGAIVTFGPAVVTNGGGNTNFSWGGDTCSGQSIATGGTCQITINFNGPSGSSTGRAR